MTWPGDGGQGEIGSGDAAPASWSENETWSVTGDAGLATETGNETGNETGVAVASETSSAAETETDGALGSLMVANVESAPSMSERKQAPLPADGAPCRTRPARWPPPRPLALRRKARPVKLTLRSGGPPLPVGPIPFHSQTPCPRKMQ